MLYRLVHLFSLIWRDEQVPQDFKDVAIIHLYKHKGGHTPCDNHHGISPLAVAGKILTCVLLNRLSNHTSKLGVVPESHCGFRKCRGTVDMKYQ